MFGENTSIDSLTTRKLLLIAESNLNRDRLIQDVKTISSGCHEIARYARSWQGISDCAISLMTAFDGHHHRKESRHHTHSSWGDTLSSGTRLITALWCHFRPPAR